MNNLYFNKKSALEDYDLIIVNAIEYPFVTKKIETVYVEGNRNGTLTIENEEYEDLSISVTFRLIKMDNYKNRMRDINFWLSNIEDSRLFFEDYREKCYKVKYCSINNIKDVHFNSADFTVVFNLFPYIYKNEEFPTIVSNNSNIYYDGDLEGYPIINLDLGEGERNLSITIGENEFQLKGIEGYVVIDSSRSIIINENKQSLGKKMIGNFPYLRPGVNNISWEGEINKFEILKNTIYKG